MKPIKERDIPLIERVVITHLIKEDGRIAGAAGFRLDAEETITIQAKTVILCTGAGGFKPNGFPVCDLTHDGTIMAYQIGAKVTGKEWNDGHSGRSVNPAACYDGWGDMFDRIPGTNGVEIHHDLGVEANYQAYVLGNPVGGGPPGRDDCRHRDRRPDHTEGIPTHGTPGPWSGRRRQGPASRWRRPRRGRQARVFHGRSVRRHGHPQVRRSGADR